MNDRIGQQLGNYRLVALLGHGGYAEVYLGQHVRLNLQAAIKLLQTHLTGNEAEHFQQEAQTIATLAHPSIVRVFDFDVQDGVPFLVMDYALNGSLRRRHPKGSVVPLPLIVSFVKQVASALQYAHEQKFIHRDVKPENMLLGRYQEVLLSDFGIATIAHNTSSQRTEAMEGTVPYMAPEQLEGHPRPASDQYALAVVVYEWLCGQRPFEGSVTEVLFQHVRMPPPPLRERVPTIPSEVEQVVLRALAKDPKSRFACVQDFALALEQACSASRVFSAPSTGEVTVAADPSGLSLVQNQLSAQLSLVDEPQVEPALAIERNASLPTTPAGPVHARPLWKVPTSLTSFVGRQQDVASISTLLMRPDVHLLTLTGPGGIGKTRLSLQVATKLADQFADGVCFVNLAPLSDAELVVPTIAQALGVRELGNQPLLESLKDHLRDKQLLLLLDNFEQVVSTAPVVAQLLAAAPRLHVLVTSRTSLHLSGEHEFVVPPLSLPDLRDLPPLDRLTEYGAVRLFIERAQAVQSDFAMTEGNATASAAICHQLDGLPLAIELAAGRSKLFSPQALLPRLRNRLKLLVGGARDLPLRQQTLRGTIAWSYDLLDQDEKTLFRRLSVFVGGCTLEAAEAVCHPDRDLEGDVLDAVERLVDKSLLRQEAQADGEPRLLMLETIREYALERLAASGETEATRRRHADYYLALAEQAEPLLAGEQQVPWLNRLEQEHENLRAALTWVFQEAGGADLHLKAALREQTLRLVGALWSFWYIHCHYREGKQWLQAALALMAQRSTSPQTQGADGGDTAQDVPDQEQVQAISTLVRAKILAGAGVFEQLYNHDVARSLHEESLQASRAAGDPLGMAAALNDLAWVALRQANYEQASRLGQQSLALGRALADAHSIAAPLLALGAVALYQHQYEQARSCFEESLLLWQNLGDKGGCALLLHLLGYLAFFQGQYTRVTPLIAEGMRLYQEEGNTLGFLMNLHVLAELAVAQKRPRRAARLLAAAHRLREAIGFSESGPPAFVQDRIKWLETSTRTQLGEATFSEMWTEGRAMELAQVLTYAFEADSEASEQALIGQEQGTTREPILLAVETKDALPTETAQQQANQEDASSIVPPGTLSSPPSPPLSPRRALKQHFGGLTSREREVARLVVQGKSNRAIADELVVGVSTVEAHISHIFTKLGFSSRAQIAAWAVDKGLAKAPQDVEGTRQ